MLGPTADARLRKCAFLVPRLCQIALTRILGVLAIDWRVFTSWPCLWCCW